MSKPDLSSLSTELRRLVRKRKSVKGSIDVIRSYVERFDPAIHSHRQIQGRLNKLLLHITELTSIQNEIEYLDQGCEDDEERLQLEDDLSTLTALMEDLIDKHQPSVNTSTFQNNSHSSIGDSVKLPTINIPTFNGDLENWTSFIDTFNALFHNNASLNNVQKLHYLKSSVSNAAADVIKGFSITAENYQVAYNELVKQYENTALTIQTHIRALLNSPKVHTASAAELRRLHHHVISHVRSLKALHQPVQYWDAWLTTITCCKLDATTAGEWQLSQTDNELPPFERIELFLSKRIAAYEIGNISLHDSKPGQHKGRNYEAKVFFTKKPESNYFKCVLCASQHKLYACNQFNKMSVPERKDVLNKFKLCFNCLNYGHQVASCNFSGCPRCGKKHNSKIHDDNSESTPEPGNPSQEVQSISTNNSVLYASNSHHHTPTTISTVMLTTAIVYAHGPDGQRQCCRAVLDSGSQLNFITTECVDKLGLSHCPSILNINGVGSMSSTSSQSVQATISSRFNDLQFKVTLHSLPVIVQSIPSQPVKCPVNIPKHIKNQLADPEFYTPGPIDMLLGAELFYELLERDKCVLSEHVMLQQTRLGWIVTGKLAFDHYNTMVFLANGVKNAMPKVMAANSALSFFISKSHSLRSEEIKAEEHFNQTVTRNIDGRFVVRLPLCADATTLAGSQQMAKRRFFNLERRLVKDSALSLQYKSFMDEYLELDHMEVVEMSRSKPTYYLPHHPVFKAGSSTTKVRVVFDGSAAAPSGHSLNDLLLKGPKVQPDISKILWRFRFHQVAITADIAKMYRQVVVASEDRDLQRILYRSSPDELLQEYRLKTVTYGTKSASFLSTRCLVQLAKECNDMPIKRMVMQDFYVDDLISGGSTEDQCFTFYEGLQALLDSAGFHLRKWCSNSPSLLKRIPDAQEDPNYMVKLSEEDVISTLGLLWQPFTDCFKFAIKDWSSPPCMTKRTLLSDVNSIYDPIGLIVPVLIKGKIFIQQL